MRGVALFVTGLMIGSILQGISAQDIRINGASLNHIMVRVADVEQAKKLYIDTMGFREAFSFKNADGTPGFTYLQISRDTFLELMPASAQNPPGLGHIGLQVADINQAVQHLRTHGLMARDPNVSQRTNARISTVQTGPGVSFELLEFPPDSLARKAMDAWK